MSELSDLFLTGMLAYGPPALGLALLVSALGVPLPGAMFLLAAGAFMRHGALSWSSVIPTAIIAVVAGDSIGYWVGRLGGTQVTRRLQGRSVRRKAQSTFERRGGLAVWLTRFLLTPLALPVNLIAGSSYYPFSRFIWLVASGELLWIAIYAGLGYVSAESWELLNDLAGNLSGLLVGVVVLGVGSYLGLRGLRKRTVAAPSSRSAVSG